MRAIHCPCVELLGIVKSVGNVIAIQLLMASEIPGIRSKEKVAKLD